jgi:Tfp pilus assembly protein PilV
MSGQREKGFTIVEVVVAVLLLTTGVMALVGSSAMVTRMIGRGRESTLVGQVATTRAERLRQVASSTAVPCTAPAFKSDSAAAASGIAEKWVLLPAIGAGVTRTFRMTFTYRVPRGSRTDTMLTTVLCK